MVGEDGEVERVDVCLQCVKEGVEEVAVGLLLVTRDQEDEEVAEVEG